MAGCHRVAWRAAGVTMLSAAESTEGLFELGDAPDGFCAFAAQGLIGWAVRAADGPSTPD